MVSPNLALLLRTFHKLKFLLKFEGKKGKINFKCIFIKVENVHYWKYDVHYWKYDVYYWKYDVLYWKYDVYYWKYDVHYWKYDFTL